MRKTLPLQEKGEGRAEGAGEAGLSGLLVLLDLVVQAVLLGVDLRLLLERDSRH